MSSEAAMVLNKPHDMPALKSTLSKDDDDDDVVLGGRSTTTPRSAANNNETKNGGMNGMTSNDMTRSVISPRVLQRTDSQKSIPSRPQSSMGGGPQPPDMIKQKTFDRNPNSMDRQKSPSPEQNSGGVHKTDNDRSKDENVTSFTAIMRQKSPVNPITSGSPSPTPPSQSKPVSLNSIIGGTPQGKGEPAKPIKPGERILSASKDTEKNSTNSTKNVERVISPTPKVVAKGDKGDPKSRPQSARIKKSKLLGDLEVCL